MDPEIKLCVCKAICSGTR